ncbi:STAS domain-containing protein [Imhoffiella purpurea]|uniref:STAS domain-containing protein n=1 Tax=Imhoffiella purpurea TaxID=1249627 RepID=W9VB97_9GAMM|nr:STAS domain-containing protein [Imhoffiella purpurea]EXJ16843.1 hypothetical protein D779_2454 [Imhoffiella purpurea]
MSPHPVGLDEDERLAFEGELTIYTAAESYARLRAFLADRDRCVLDLSAVSELDCAGLQVLLWTKQLAERQGKQLLLDARSPALDDAIAILHLAPGLGIESCPMDQDVGP